MKVVWMLDNLQRFSEHYIIYYCVKPYLLNLFHFSHV